MIWGMEVRRNTEKDLLRRTNRNKGTQSCVRAALYGLRAAGFANNAPPRSRRHKKRSEKPLTSNPETDNGKVWGEKPCTFQPGDTMSYATHRDYRLMTDNGQVLRLSFEYSAAVLADEINGFVIENDDGTYSVGYYPEELSTVAE